jgi:hypothetical protein
MGIDLTLRMNGVKKRDLSAFLRSEGFEPTRSIVPQRGSSYFFWFDEVDHKSLSGVEVALTPGSISAGAVDTDLVLEAHCKIWASIHDVAKLNNVVREARRRFGGRVDGDYGKNRYIPLWEDQSTPLSRGVTSAYDRSLEVLESLRFAIPEEIIRQPPDVTNDPNSRRILEVIGTHDPARVVYNGLIPMIVAVLEHYFVSIFLVLAEYDEAASAKLRDKKVSRAIVGDDLLRLASGEISPQRIMAREYSFQSLKALSTTFRDWFRLDLNQVLAPKKRVLNRNVSLLSGLSALIDFRHGVVHRLAVDRTLDRAALLYQVEVAIEVIDETTGAIARQYGFAVERL